MSRLIQRICKVDDLDEVIKEIKDDPNLWLKEIIPYRYIVISPRLTGAVDTMLLQELMLLVRDES